MKSKNWKKLCDKHKTDKSNYSWFYPYALEPYRGKPLKILEIGVKQGNSIQMFSEYFQCDGNQKAQIYGLDIGKEWLKNKKLNKDNITIFTGNQSKIETLYELYNKTGKLDIIIDDGSHLVNDILTSFEFFKDKFNYMYVIEDTTLTLYGKHYEIINKDNANYLSQLEDDNNCGLLQNRDFYESYWSSLVRAMDEHPTSNPYSITFYHNLICIKNENS
jgi:hypothetical protein